MEGLVRKSTPENRYPLVFSLVVNKLVTPNKSAKLLLSRELLSCSDLLSAFAAAAAAVPAAATAVAAHAVRGVPANRQTSMLNANAHKHLKKLLPSTCRFCLFHRLMTKQAFLMLSAKQITPNLFCETSSTLAVKHI